MATTSALGTGIVIPIDYTSRDYLSIRSDLLNAVSSYLPEWTSTAATDFGVALIELFAYVGDLDSYYIDRVANEAFLATAQQRSSVLNLAYLIDYSPHDSTAASTTLQVTQRPGTPAFDLPQGAQFSTQGTPIQPPVIFELAQDHSIPANPGSAPVMFNSTTARGVVTPLTLVQGVTIADEQVGASNGNASQQFTLFNLNVIDGSVQVYVDEGQGPKPWQAVGHLIDANSIASVYMVAVDANGVYYVIFGDGSSGRIPNPSALITATYRIGGGAVGNVGASQIVVDLTNLGYFSSVTNPTPAVGGADPETIAQIQFNAPRSITAAGRCVSIQDYASVTLDLPGITKTSAGVAGASSAVNLYIHPAGGPYRSTDLSALVNQLAPTVTWGGPGPTSPAGLSGYLDSRKMVGTSITVIPPQYQGTVGYVPIVITLSVNVLPQYQNLQIQQDVLAALAKLFDFGSITFGQRFSLSAVYHTVQGVTGVDYLNVNVMARGDSGAGTVGDIVCAYNEIPVLSNPNTGTSQITVNTTGGL